MVERLSKFNSDKIIKIRLLLKEIVPIGFTILKNYDEGKSKNIYITFYANYIVRFMSCYHSVHTLLIDFEKDKAINEYAIALLLRASLLDCLTLLYFKSYLKEEQNNPSLMDDSIHDAKIIKFLTSHIKRVFKSQISNKKNNGIFKKITIKEMVDFFKAEYNILFKEDFVINYSDPSAALKYGAENELETSNMLFRLDDENHASNNDYKLINQLYNIYSKYDHFGILTKIYQNLNINDIFQNILTSLHFMIEGINYSLKFIEYGMKNKADFELIRQRLGELKYTTTNKKFIYISPELRNDEAIRTVLERKLLKEQVIKDNYINELQSRIFKLEAKLKALN